MGNLNNFHENMLLPEEEATAAQAVLPDGVCLTASHSNLRSAQMTGNMPAH